MDRRRRGRLYSGMTAHRVAEAGTNLTELIDRRLPGGGCGNA
jgi:hypothetical protein